MPDIETLQMALVGYRAQREKISDKIREIEERLGGRMAVIGDGAAPARKRRKLSAAALAHIRAAQKKRWAEFRKQETAKATPKKKVSPEVLKKRLAGLAKARAARAAKRAATN